MTTYTYPGPAPVLPTGSQTGPQTEQQYFKVGSFVSPLPTSTGNTLLQDADPALYQVTQFLQAVIQTHLGPRFDEEMSNAGYSQFVGKASSTTVPFNPLPFLTENQLVPPLLAVWREDETYLQRTAFWWSYEESWKLLWVLPPLRAPQFLALASFLTAAARVITNRLKLGYDPSYLGAAMLIELAGLEYIVAKKPSYGPLQKVGTDLFFPTLGLDIEVHEIEVPCPAPPATSNPLAGADPTILVTDSTGSDTVVAVDQNL